MGASGSSSKKKSSKKRSDRTSSKKKTNRRKESKKRRRIDDSVSAYSDDDSLNSKRTSSFTSKSDYMRRINKTKKLRRDYSVSSYSDDQSMSSDSDSLSTYDKRHKGRKAKRSRIGLNSTKKRARKRFASPGGNADAHKIRKRKRLGRDLVAKPRKKSSKKSKKHLSSSSSSDSQSCSTCQSRSSGSTADGKRRSKVMLNKEIRRPRGRELYKAHRKRKIRSPSCSSCGRGSDQSVSHSDRALAPVNNNSRPLRSIIAVAVQPHDEGENRWEKDPYKEEIMYDHDDYPSPKSLDSNEGGSKRESDNHYDGASDKRNHVENVAGEEVTEMGKSGIDKGDQNNAGDHQSDRAHINNFEKEKEAGVSVPNAAVGGDNLESVLRQKALENLRKFRGELQTGPRSTANLKMNNEIDVNESSTGSVDIVQNKSTNEGSSNAQQMNQRSGPSLKRVFSQLREVKKHPDSEHVEKEPGMAKQIVAHPPNEGALLGCSEEEKCTSSHAVLAKLVSRSDTSPGAGATNACSSSTTEPSYSVQPMSGERRLEERKNEAKDGSEFEQKTMSVMRGGEMVQVSYKVYIPKKAPALARRQLRR